VEHWDLPNTEIFQSKDVAPVEQEKLYGYDGSHVKRHSSQRSNDSG
jgi:hypothetical protein